MNGRHYAARTIGKTQCNSRSNRGLTMLKLLLLAAATLHAERDRPKMPAIDKPVMFNTPEADAILKAMQIFPADNPWNEDISQRPVAANSRQMIAAIGAGGRLAYN